MENSTVEYRGYQVLVTPERDHEDLWDFSYRITKDGDELKSQTGHSVQRRATLGGYQDAQTASEAGAELARVEIDNYLALHS